MAETISTFKKVRKGPDTEAVFKSTVQGWAEDRAEKAKGG